jgi:hypothetical protein
MQPTQSSPRRAPRLAHASSSLDSPVSSAELTSRLTEDVAVNVKLTKQTRREERLKKVGRAVSTDVGDLCRIFRIFDADNDHLIGQREFQTGLIAMGYEEAQNVVVVDRIMRQIDTDCSGHITEDEFVQYFSHRKLQDLKDTLSTYVDEASPCVVRVVDYGASTDELRQSGPLDVVQVTALPPPPSPPLPPELERGPRYSAGRDAHARR